METKKERLKELIIKRDRIIEKTDETMTLKRMRSSIRQTLYLCKRIRRFENENND